MYIPYAHKAYRPSNLSCTPMSPAYLGNNVTGDDNLQKLKLIDSYFSIFFLEKRNM